MPKTSTPPSPRASGMRRIGVRGVVWLLLYAGALAAAQYLVIAPQFSYLGFEAAAPGPATLLVLASTYVLCASRLPRSWERPSTVVYWTLFLLVVAPIHVVSALLYVRTEATWTMVFSTAAAFWLLGLCYSVRPPRIPRPSLPRRAYWFCIGLLFVGLLAAVISSYGVRFNLVALAEVYDVRDEFRDSFDEVSSLARYAVTWLGGVVAPIIIARGLFTKRYIFVAMGVFTQLFLVSITGFRSLLFSSVLVGGIALAMMWGDIRRLGSKVAVAATAGIAGIGLFDYLTQSVALSSLFIRRMVLTAGVNTNYYFEYFSEWPKVQLGHSIFSRFVEYPYDLPPANLMGLIYYENPETSANANLWADAFSNFGVVGILVFTALLGGIFVLVDGLSDGLPWGVPLIALAMPAVSLSNSAMLTVFVTHGLLLALVLVALMPSEPATTGESAGEDGETTPGDSDADPDLDAADPDAATATTSDPSAAPRSLPPGPLSLVYTHRRS